MSLLPRMQLSLSEQCKCWQAQSSTVERIAMKTGPAIRAVDGTDISVDCQGLGGCTLWCRLAEVALQTQKNMPEKTRGNAGATSFLAEVAAEMHS